MKMLKITLFCLFGVMQCVYAIKKIKIHIIFHIPLPYIIVAPLLRLSETQRFWQNSSFWNARWALIGQLSSAVWLAEHLKHVMKCYTSYHIWKHTVSPRHGGGGDNTTVRIKVTPSFFAYTFVRVVQIFRHHDIDLWGRVWMRPFRKVWLSLNF